MARGRKKQYINKITSKDKNMLQAFKNVCYLSEEMLKIDLQQADRRVKNFERDKYIEKVSYMDRKTKNAKFAYRLTKKGQKLCEANLGLDKFYHSSSPHHDLGLAKVYLEQDEYIKDRWIVESELRDMFLKHTYSLAYEERDRLEEMLDTREISATDGGYFDSNGDLVTVEIITSSYRANHIEAKKEFSQRLDATYIQYKV